MRLLFVTDLHGCIWKYDKLYTTARQYGVDIVLNGGDMLPKEGLLFQQDQFMTMYLQQHFKQFEKAGIHYLCFLGNDDLKIFDPLFEDICLQYQHIHNIAQKKVTIHNREFIGMNLVVDYPFRLKDRCRKDTDDYIFQKQFGTGLLSTAHGWKEIDDWFEYANNLPTIEDELKILPVPVDMKQAVYMIHMPPANTGLDVCRYRERVGSIAIYQFLQAYQPKYALHGHIHESPDVSGVWQSQIGKTICVQPGQMARYTYVIIDCSTNTVDRYED
jgi:Icc-related predicted phosphoesterase